MTENTIGCELPAFMNFYIDAIHKRDLKAISALGHPGDPDESMNSEYVREQLEMGREVVAYKPQTYQQPRWSIFKEYRLHPEPTYRVDVENKGPGDKRPGGKYLHGVVVKNPSLAVRMPTELKEAFSENQIGVLVSVQVMDSLDNIELIDQLPIKARFPSLFGLL